jgi:hypothetical protein
MSDETKMSPRKKAVIVGLISLSFFAAAWLAPEKDLGAAFCFFGAITFMGLLNLIGQL